MANYTENNPDLNGNSAEEAQNKLESKICFNYLFDNLQRVIEVSRDKFDREKASNGDRQKWARILVVAISAYGDLLRDRTLEDLVVRVEALEEFSHGR